MLIQNQLNHDSTLNPHILRMAGMRSHSPIPRNPFQSILLFPPPIENLARFQVHLMILIHGNKQHLSLRFAPLKKPDQTRATKQFQPALCCNYQTNRLKQYQ